MESFWNMKDPPQIKAASSKRRLDRAMVIILWYLCLTGFRYDLTIGKHDVHQNSNHFFSFYLQIINSCPVISSDNNYEKVVCQVIQWTKWAF